MGRNGIYATRAHDVETVLFERIGIQMAAKASGDRSRTYGNTVYDLVLLDSNMSVRIVLVAGRGRRGSMLHAITYADYTVQIYLIYSHAYPSSYNPNLGIPGCLLFCRAETRHLYPSLDLVLSLAFQVS